MPAWLQDEYVPEHDQRVYEASGFGGAAGVGSTPALIVVDMQLRTIGENLPVLDAIEASYATACGEPAYQALPQATAAVQYFRSRGDLVIHACVAPKRPSSSDAFQRINPGVGKLDARAYEFHPDVAPIDGEPIVPKEAASAFFGTPIVRLLIERGVDTVVLAGCTTSGCIRATAVDAFSHNFRVNVLADAVYDRSPMSHAVSLYEMSQKYGDVVTFNEFVQRMDNASS